MKRIILIFILLIVSIILVGCNVDKTLIKIDKENNEDVKNIINYIDDSKDCEFTMTMDNKIRAVQLDGSSFYMCEINDQEYDIICAYIDEKDYTKRFKDTYYYLKATWYKCTNQDFIDNEVKGLKLTGIFIVYDALITYDVINEKEYNYKCKYYREIETGNDENYLISDCYKLKYNKLIMYINKENFKKEGYFFGDYVFNLGYEIRSNSEGLKRVVFDNISFACDDEIDYSFISKEFGESYQYFSEWLIDEKDYEKIVTSNRYFELSTIFQKVSIDLKKFIELVKEINLKE